MLKNALLASVLLLGVWAEHSEAQTPTAVIIPNAYKQFLDANGKPLSAGTVHYYTPGTTTAKTTWQDPYQSVANANPITLNGAGEALIWGSGIYREVVYDVNNNLIWDQLTGGYNCVGGGAVPLGANGAIQYNNNGIFGGLPLGTTGQVLLANSSGPATWGAVPVGSIPVTSLTGLGAGVLAALQLPLDGTGALCAATGCTLTNATLNNPTLHNATFTGTVTGLPGGGGTCTDRSGTVLAHCIASSAIFNEELGTDPVPGGTGHAMYAWMTGLVAGWDVFEAPALLSTDVQAAEASVREQIGQRQKSIAKIPTLEAHIKQLADAAHVQLK